jgi:hypothetical protein
LTCNEIHRLFNTLIVKPISRPATPPALVDLETPTPTPRSNQPLPAPTSPWQHDDHELLLEY